MPAQAQPLMELSEVTLRYRLYTGRSNSLRDLAASVLGGRKFSHYRTLFALKNVSLACREGDRLAVVGPNGAGKTSLLRVMAGVYPPTQGTVAIRGHVVPLLELGLGFSPELTGAENIVLAGVLLGRTRAEIREAIPGILDFAQLQDFRDVPLKYYSSGMSARLAFSVAMETHPDILLLDEVFAVGDLHWIKKAEDRIMSLLDRAKVVVMVSHNPSFLRRLCTRAVYLDRGMVRAAGDVNEVLDAYEKQTGGGVKVLDARDGSAVRLSASITTTAAAATVQLKALGIPMLGESWVGVFPPGADRDGHVAWRRVSPDVPEVRFVLARGGKYEARLYRWTPAGECLEASCEVQS